MVDGDFALSRSRPRRRRLVAVIAKASLSGPAFALPALGDKSSLSKGNHNETPLLPFAYI
jgi:hypothetical protein